MTLMHDNSSLQSHFQLLTFPPSGMSRNQIPEDRGQKSEDRYSGFELSTQRAMPYAYNYLLQFLTFPPSHLPTFQACPAPRIPHPATRNPHTPATRIFSLLKHLYAC